VSRALNDLSPEMRPLAVEFLARLVENGIHVMVIETKRTPEQQALNLKNGVSWTPNSRHLTGDAIDICPYAFWDLLGPDKLQWDGGDPIWSKIGAIGEACGLIWGGRWAQRDLGHFECPRPKP
jgi:hypothetical protein